MSHPPPGSPDPSSPDDPSGHGSGEGAPQPGYGQPGYGQPPYGQPPYGQPPYGQPPYDQPPYDQPSYAQPSFAQPAYGQAPYGAAPYGQPAYGYPAVAPTNGKATGALWVGVSSLVLFWCCGLGVVGLVAIVLGVKARSEIRRSGGQQGGDGIALAGIITGSIAVVLGLLVIAFIVIALAAGDSSYQFDTSGV